MSRFKVTRYPSTSAGRASSLRAAIEDLEDPKVGLNDIIQLRTEPGQWRIFLHGTWPLKVIMHQGTLRSAMAMYTLLRSGTP